MANKLNPSLTTKIANPGVFDINMAILGKEMTLRSFRMPRQLDRREFGNILSANLEALKSKRLEDERRHTALKPVPSITQGVKPIYGDVAS